MDKKTAIKQLKQMALKDPQTYDISKLNDAIEMINKAKDLDALLILGKPQDAMLRDNLYVLQQSEIDAMKAAIEEEGFVITEVRRLEPELNRDDYAFVLKDEDKKLVWISKIRPLFDDNEYSLLAVGMNFPAESYSTMEELIEATRKLLRE